MTPDEPILEVLRDADGNFYCLEISTLVRPLHWFLLTIAESGLSNRNAGGPA